MSQTRAVEAGSAPPSQAAGREHATVAASLPALAVRLQRAIGNRATAAVLSGGGRRMIARAPNRKPGSPNEWEDPLLPGVTLEPKEAGYTGGNGRFAIAGLPGVILIYTGSYRIQEGKTVKALDGPGVQALLVRVAAAAARQPSVADITQRRKALFNRIAGGHSHAFNASAANWQQEAAQLVIDLQAFNGADAAAEAPHVAALGPSITAAQRGFSLVAPLGAAVDTYYAGVTTFGPAGDPAPSGTPVAVTGAAKPLKVRQLRAAGVGLRWWASAAMELRRASIALGTMKRVGEIRLLPVCGGVVRIAVKRPSITNPAGEFIVMAGGTQLTWTAADGLATAGHAAATDRVSYLGFIDRLATARGQLTEQQVARALLQMVSAPSACPVLDAGLLDLMRELLVTILVAEPARGRSVLFNAVMTLEAIDRGVLTFAQAFSDDGAFAMTGGGTAAAGRRSEAQERLAATEQAAGRPLPVLLLDTVTRRQFAQFSNNPGADITNLATQYG